MPRKENPGPISAQAQQDLVSEGIENYELPKSVVMKIAKSAVRALGFPCCCFSSLIVENGFEETSILTEFLCIAT